MRNARIIVARYNKGIMSKDQVVGYIAEALNPVMDAEIIDWIMDQIKEN